MSTSEGSSDRARPGRGVFRDDKAGQIVVMWQGREIARYDTMDDFVTSHLEGIDALERNQEELLADAYRDDR